MTVGHYRIRDPVLESNDSLVMANNQVTTNPWEDAVAKRPSL